MKLKKELTLLDVFSITAGAMMSAGLFLLPGMAYLKTGPAALVSYLLAGVLATAGMLSQAELTSAMPKAGGTYFYVTRSMGSAVGTVYGLITFLALSLKSAFALFGMAAFTNFLIDVDIRLIAILLCVLFLVLNLVGVKGAGRVQVVLVIVILAVLAVYSFMGVPQVKASRFEPFMTGGAGSILATAGFVFVSYGGLLKVASLAEEVKEPGRVLPLGMILSLLAVAVVYSAVIFVTYGVLDSDTLGKTLTPVSDAAEVFMGKWGAVLLSLTAILAFSSAANAAIMGASRYPLALSRDSLIPGLFSRVNGKFNTPHYALLATGVFMMGALFLNLDAIVKAASSVLILTYLFSCLANIIMRESRIQNYQPAFKAPLYPWIQIAGVIGFCLLLIEIGSEAWLVGGALSLVGLLVYMLYGRRRVKREYALLHCIERITAKELTTHSLEEELKEIIRERDDIVKDRFDSLVEKCTVLDIDEPMSAESFFKIVADHLAQGVDMGPAELVKLYLEREKENDTVIAKGLAIPHIVVPGEKTFNVLIARCRPGVLFLESASRVNAAFVLMGSSDERNFHLRALAAIAQIAMDPHFEKKWMSAKSVEALRDIVLLNPRKR